MIEWDQWQTLLAVFRTGTYVKAAKTLKVDATTIGRRIKLLEKRVGYQLFMRQDGQLYPTANCEALLDHIESASEALRAAEHESAASEAGAIWRDLRLAAPPFLVKNLFAPAIDQLTNIQRIRVEFMSIANNVSLSRRETDIAIRIDDRLPDFQFDTEQIENEQIGVLDYAIYCKADIEQPEELPWAGLREDYIRTSGSKAMQELTEGRGFRFRAFSFDALNEITASGVARTMLPCISTDVDTRLRRISGIVLQQPLWMLYHRQDAEIQHLQLAREWIRDLSRQSL